MVNSCNVCKLIIFSFYCLLFVQFLHLINKPAEIQMDLHYVLSSPGLLRRMERRIKRNKSNLEQIQRNFKRPIRHATDLRYVLKWTVAYSHYSTSVFKDGQLPFLDANCSYYNCFMTNDKHLLPDLRHYDAVLFDVENDWDEQPYLRSPHQAYIFTASESAHNYPVCEPQADEFYNLTWTYRLDSDLIWTYVNIVDEENNIVGPKLKMDWIHNMKPVTDKVKQRLKKKKKAVAWFVSNCYAKSNREKVAEELTKALKNYNLTIDIYGWCGKLTCPRDRIENCLEILERDYYFYLSFENSLSEDYVTEKILYPLNHYAVPIVFGGADYSRFLPPDSYIDVSVHNITAVARMINEAITNKTRYYEYFRWHNHYKYLQAPPIADICNLCRLLNEGIPRSRTLDEFRKWWNPDFRHQCTRGNRSKFGSFEKFNF